MSLHPGTLALQLHGCFVGLLKTQSLKSFMAAFKEGLVFSAGGQPSAAGGARRCGSRRLAERIFGMWKVRAV